MPKVSTFLHVHGFFMTAWVVLFLLQTLLISVRRISLHRKLGFVGAGLAAMVISLGVAATVVAARREVVAKAEDVPTVLAVLALELTQMTMFGLFVAAGIWLRGRTDYHKRLMLLATTCMLPNPLVRSIRFLHIEGFLTPMVIWSLCILCVVVVDSRVNKRLHPVFRKWAIAEACMLWLAYFVGASEAWQNFALQAVR
jgi:hypothetical protein